MIDPARLENVLGVPFEPFGIASGGREVAGCVSAEPHPRRAMLETVRRTAARTQELGATVVAGIIDTVHDPGVAPGVFLYAFEGLTAADVAALAEVGTSENQAPPGAFEELLKQARPELQAWAQGRGVTPERMAEYANGVPVDQSRAFLDRVYQRCPYRVVYVDRKGLIADFIDEVNARDAAWVESQIGEFNPEAFDAVDGEMVDAIRNTRLFRLWWD